MAKWLAREFDWTTGKYTGNYYNIAQAGVVAVFADSYTGSDTNAGTAAAPFKTLSKCITTLNSTGANGSRIFMNGIFSENLPTTQTYWYEFIGCGNGNNGRTVLYYNSTLSTRVQLGRAGQLFGHRWHNIETLNYNMLAFTVTHSTNHRFVNSVIKDVSYGATGNQTELHLFYSFLINSTVHVMLFYGTRSTLTGVNLTGGSIVILTQQTLSYSNLFNNGFSLNINGNLEVDGQYIDIANGNYHVRQTSPLLFAGEIDVNTGVKNHIGVATQGFDYNSLSKSFTTDGGATLTNLTVDGSKLIRIDPLIDASIITGYVDFGSTYPIIDLSILNNFDFDALGVSKGIFESLTGTPRPTLTVLMKYGNTTAEVDSCPWLEIEYGKRPSYSGTVANRKGNGDNSFDHTAEQFISARFIKLTISLKNR